MSRLANFPLRHRLGNGRRVLVFGDMFELGEGSMNHHRQVGKHCITKELDAVFSTGTETSATDGVLNDSMHHQHFDSKQDLLTSLQDWLKAGDKLLVKGSRGMAMETIIEGLSKNRCCITFFILSAMYSLRSMFFNISHSVLPLLQF